MELDGFCLGLCLPYKLCVVELDGFCLGLRLPYKLCVVELDGFCLGLRFVYASSGSSSSSRVYFNCTTYIHVYIIWYEIHRKLIITIIKQAVHFTILLYNLVLAWLFSRLPAIP